ncbi:cytochrome c assembly protein [Leptospira weilii str. Ecochallenge]|uniref:Cytochrome c assembly protein n=1 Tax=Leptospira weilii str. Ecochallenge TaxID=1049986 RepID=N1UAB6_9LEPT|nr:cytochrome c assembly protein [Leptospira weilii str. Ecochallenge]
MGLGLVCGFFNRFPGRRFIVAQLPERDLTTRNGSQNFYFHVPVAWVALYGPIFSLVFAVLYLVRKESKWDLLSLSANQIALLFAVGVIFSGRIWALSAWGVPWDKTDARLQSFTVLFISLIAYFVFRILIADASKKKYSPLF